MATSTVAASSVATITGQQSPSQPGALLLLLAAGVGVSTVLTRFWWQGRRRPMSYPGDAVPPDRRILRRPCFRSGTGRRVEAGWRPEAERQPGGGLLPHPVSGQQVWCFDKTSVGDNATMPDFEPALNPNASDQLFRAARLNQWRGPRPDTSMRPETPLDAARKGFAFYRMLQCDDGHWAGDYGGPHFLLPGLVIAAYVTGGLKSVLSDAHWRAVEVYLRNHQQTDGGWGTHLESPSTMFGSVLNYIALRLVGASADDPACVRGREFLADHGGALYAPSWAKTWCCILGVYDWSGLAPVPPELWLLPSWFPVHPGRFWCHCRMVYLSMCYLFGRRFTFDAEADPITAALRSELYPGREYASIDWHRHMHSIADIDNYSPVHWAMRTLQRALAVYERMGPSKFLRARALSFVEEYLRAEDAVTNYLTIGPVSKAMHMVCIWVAEGGVTDPAAASRSVPVLAHAARLPAYLWVAEDGMKCQGYNGSMAWDAGFAVQAAAEAGLDAEFPDMCAKAWGWLLREQVRALPTGDWRHWRQPIRGGWGFSTAEQAWPVSDTTAEAFLAVLALRSKSCVTKCAPMPEEHYFDAVQFLLSYQNNDGGWATYENRRGWKWYECLNPSEVFGDIMIDYSYVECTSSSMGALREFSKHFPHHRRNEIDTSIRKGCCFLKAMQRDDGSWYGCWGNCFTYGCWFGVEGLVHAGETPSICKEIRRCVVFLLGKQNTNGGWGEDFESCFNRDYTSCDKLYGSDSNSTVVHTAWALLALMAGDCADVAAVQRGVAFLMRRQLASGDWAQENISGVFNRSVGITYTSFRNVFPLWALGRFAKNYAPRHGLLEKISV
eukprot:TRINITY_DN23781_c2_g1_i1.p1 TRINITY_DN23781_c2_g1~~TRINITY_DN23781_c2_g1_i1.p1  ORF type:complete len:865 (-),score=112.79 TRINITY_DN23781_c2_g1_i1:234-2747(-)